MASKRAKSTSQKSKSTGNWLVDHRQVRALSSHIFEKLRETLGESCAVNPALCHLTPLAGQFIKKNFNNAVIKLLLWS